MKPNNTSFNMKMSFQRAVTNAYLDFIIKGDDTGCREDRGQLWALPGNAERLQQRNETRGASEQS